MSEDIDQMGIKEAFYEIISYLDTLGEKDEEGEELYPGLDEVYKKGRYGIRVEFDLYDYLNGTMQLKDKVGKALYRGKPIELSKLWTELEERTITMKKWLKENQEDEFPIQGYDLSKINIPQGRPK